MTNVTDRLAPTAGNPRTKARAPTMLARAFREFATVPSLMILGFGVLAALSIVADQSNIASLGAMRHDLAHVIGSQAATTTLQAIATGIVTVTSITFSVVLLALQQTASSLSPVVFDQFVRRRGNQVFLGFFVGLAVYAYVVLVAVQAKTPPITGAFFATVLTVVAMVFLIALIYNTVDQMRPVNVIRQIHDRVLAARRGEEALVARTRREEAANDPVRVTYRSQTTGYVTGLSLDRLEKALQQVPGAEMRLHVTLGQHVTYDSVVATVRDDDEADAESLAEEVRASVVISQRRDLDHDASTGIDDLGNIAWTSGSTAKQNPEVAREALNSLADIAARWLVKEQRPAEEPLPIVYADNDLALIFDWFYSLVVAAHESQQHMQAARVLRVLGSLRDRANPELRRRIDDDIFRLTPILDDLPPSAQVAGARRELGMP